MRFVIQPGSPITIGSGEYTLEIITPGGIAWFSDSPDQLIPDSVGQPIGGWPLTQGEGSKRRGPYQNLFATCVGFPVIIEAVPHIANTSLAPGIRAGSIYSATTGALNQPTPPIVKPQTFAQKVRSLFGLAVILLCLGVPLRAQNLPGTPINLLPGMNVLPAPNSLFDSWVVTVPPNMTAVDFIIEPIGTPGTLPALGVYDFTYIPSIQFFSNTAQGLQVAECSSSTPQLLAPASSGLAGPLGALQVTQYESFIHLHCKPPASNAYLVVYEAVGPLNSVNAFAMVWTGATSGVQACPLPLTTGGLSATFGNQTSERFCALSPTELGVNGIVLPGSSTSAVSNIIDTRGVREATLLAACTQAATVNINLYDEDGITIYTGFGITTVASAATGLHIGSEEMPQSSSTVLTAGAYVQFPQRALSFSFTNGGAVAGTCTARLFLANWQ
jgi:hypothetical protein